MLRSFPADAKGRPTGCMAEVRHPAHNCRALVTRARWMRVRISLSRARPRSAAPKASVQLHVKTGKAAGLAGRDRRDVPAFRFENAGFAGHRYCQVLVG